MKRRLTFLFWGIILIVSDQLSKYIIRFESGFYICNRGMAFGIKLPLELFYLLWIIIIFSLLFFRKKYFGENRLAVLLVLSGAFSNLFDRFFYGCVIDFIDLHFWPLFNLADVLIMIGMILLLLEIKSEKK